MVRVLDRSADLDHKEESDDREIDEPRVTVEPAPDHRRGPTVTRLAVMCSLLLGVAAHEQHRRRSDHQGAVAD